MGRRENNGKVAMGTMRNDLVANIICSQSLSLKRKTWACEEYLEVICTSELALHLIDYPKRLSALINDFSCTGSS
jgi:hypothetical protein